MKKPTIMIVDDERDNLVYLDGILADAGCEVVSASDGETALALMEAHRPALVFLDVQMPRMNGFQVLKRMRTNQALNPVPVVLLSGIGAVTGDEYDPQKIESQYGVRPDAFLAKPIEPRSVLAQIDRFLKSDPQESA